MKLATIVGARPQFIKAAVISRELGKFNSKSGCKRIEEIIIHTGQHHDHNMSDIFFREMCIPKPDFNLAICDCPHGAMTGRMLEQIEKVLMVVHPDAVLVYGDTNSTLAGALAAAKMQIPVAHVEAGLRSFNKGMPEEINRVLTDHISTLLFCPTSNSVNNLLAEGVGTKNKKGQTAIFETGDVMLDATKFYADTGKPSSNVLKLINDTKGKYYLATIHREENTNNMERLGNITAAFKSIAATTPIILPLHPRTRNVLSKYNMRIQGATITDPVGYFDMIELIKNCCGVLTDSGGLQKEAFFLGKPCITMRNETEWVELVENGFNTVTGADADAIINAEKNLSKKQLEFCKNLYGNGDAGDKILAALNSFFEGR